MRVSRITAAASVAAVVLAAGPAVAVATSTHRLTHLTVAVAPATVYVGTRTVVSGVAAPKVAGSTITLQRFLSSHWLTVSRVRTSKSGAYAFSVVAPKKPASWVLRVRATGATSKTVQLQVTKSRFLVQSRAAASVPATGTAGALVAVTGSVSPGAAGHVDLQAFSAGAWQTVATAQLTASSTFRVLVHAAVGLHRLHVVRAITAKIAGGISKTLTVTVTPEPILPVGPTPPAAPTVSINLAGTVTGPAMYSGSVIATVTAGSAAGVRSTTYALDGGAAVAYSAPVTIASAGPHTLVATTTDNAGAIATATSSWAQQAVTTAIADNFTTGGTVGPDCLVTGFDGVLPNNVNTQCVAGDIAFTAAGLALTSTAGQLANGDQQNALYQGFDASNGTFTVTARVVGGPNQLTANYQQIGLFFGPDTDHFVKVEAEHNGTGNPHLTMYYRDDGTNGTVATTALSTLAGATTVDLTIKATAAKLTVFYSIDGATPVQVGTSKAPVTPAAWFSSSGKAGIEVSNSGTTMPITATFSSFAITQG